MKKSFVIIAAIISFTVFCSFFIQNPVAGEVAYPAGYREWAHVKTSVGKSGVASHLGFHHIYANDKAKLGYVNGNYAEGSVFVFDVLEAVDQTNGDIAEGKRKLIDVMVKDSVRYAATGGWGFEEFAGDSKTERVIKMMAVQYCFNCHTKAEKTGFVFSKYRE